MLAKCTHMNCETDESQPQLQRYVKPLWNVNRHVEFSWTVEEQKEWTLGQPEWIWNSGSRHTSKIVAFHFQYSSLPWSNEALAGAVKSRCCLKHIFKERSIVVKTKSLECKKKGGGGENAPGEIFCELIHQPM